MSTQTTRLRTWLSRLLAPTLVLSLLFVSADAFAQKTQRDKKLEGMVEALEFERDPGERKPLTASTVDPVSLGVHWRLYKRVLSEGKSGVDELQALRDGVTSVGTRNDASRAFAAIALVRQRHAEGTLSASAAADSLEQVARLAPNLPHPHLARAWLLIKADPGRLGDIVRSMTTGWELAYRWPDTSIPQRFNLLVFALLAFAGASLLFLLAQLVRQFGVLSYDLVRLLPTGFSSNQAVILLLAAIIVPGLLLQSPLLSAVLLLAAFGVIQQPRERVVTGAIFALLLALPMIEEHLSDTLTWSTGTSRHLLQTQYAECDDACFEHLDAMRRESEAHDVVLDYTYWLQVYRRGQPGRIIDPEAGLALSEVESWPGAVKGHGLNLLAAAHIARDHPEDATELLARAEKLLPGDPSPSLNMLRAQQMIGDQEAARQALDRANDRDLEVTLEHLDLDRRDVNSFLRVSPLPAPLFWTRHRRANDQQVDLVTRFWPYLAGTKVPLGWSQYMGGAGLLLLLLTLPLALRCHVSTPCPSCGLARAPEDGAKNGDHAYCMSCYRTFITGASMEYQARVASEEALSQRRQLQSLTRRGLSAIAPGSGHVSAGYAIGGFLLSFVLLFGVALLVRAGGIWRPPEDLIYVDWFGWSALGWALIAISFLIGFYVASRDIQPAPVKIRTHARGAAQEEHDEH